MVAKNPEKEDVEAAIKGKNILVLGGAGFIGSNLVDRLLNIGCKVGVVDNFSTGRRENLVHILDSIELYEGDISRSAGDLYSILDRFSPNIIVHLATFASVKGAETYPIRDASNTINGTLTLISALEKYSKYAWFEKVLIASSSQIYGEGLYRCSQCKTKQTPFSRKASDISNGKFGLYCETCKNELIPLPTPETKLQQPINNYGVAKWAEEKYLIGFGNKFGIPVIAFRFYNVYGERQLSQGGETAVQSIILRKFFNGENFEVNEDGKQTRDFIYIKDAVEAMILAIKKSNESNIYNIGNHHITLLKLIESFEKAIGKQIPHQIKNVAQTNLGLQKPKQSIQTEKPKAVGTFDIRHAYADWSKAKKELGWYPTTSLEEGLRRMYEWALEHRAIV